MEDLFEQMMGSQHSGRKRKMTGRGNQNFDDLKGKALKEAMGATNFGSSGSEDFDSTKWVDMDHELGAESLGGEIELTGQSNFVDLREEEDL